MAFNIQDILGGVGGAIDTLSPMLRLGGSYYAGQRSADRMEDAAQSYRQLGQEAAGMADPWGADRRQWAQGRLDDLLADPTTSPVYQSMERRAMQALGPRLAAQGRTGSDAGSRDWLETLGDVSNQYTGQWADRYGRWGGADLDPARAAQFMMQGGQLEQDALTAAMAARLAPLGTLAGGQTSGGSEGGLGGLLRQFGNLFTGAGGGGAGARTGLGAGITPQSILQMISQLPGSSLSPELFNILGRIGNGTQDLFGGASPEMLEQIFGPGYENFITENPDWWQGGGIGDTGLGGFGIGGDWESIFGGGNGGDLDMTGFITDPFSGGGSIDDVLRGMGLGG